MPTRCPSLPSSVQGVGGPIRVRLITRNVGNPGEPAWGSWEPETRIIRLERGAKPQHRWRVFWHEFSHAALDDSGLSQLLTDAMAEALCDAYASALMADPSIWPCLR